MMYADIIVDISHEKLDRSFQYRVPLEMEDEIQVGMVVTIPFGNGNHERKGYVIGFPKSRNWIRQRSSRLRASAAARRRQKKN